MDTNKQDKNPAPKKRGRPKGVKVGPREVVWACSGVIDAEWVSEIITATTAEAAKAAFEEKNGEEPGSVQGPFYSVKGGQANPKPRRKESVSVDLDEVRLGSPISGKPIFDGWSGMAFNVVDHEDLLYFVFNKQIVESDKKRSQPRPRTVPRSEVQVS